MTSRLPELPPLLRSPHARSAYFWIVTSSLSFATMGALSRALSWGGRVDWRLVGFVRAGLMLVLSLPIALTMPGRLPFPGSPTLWVRSIVGSLGMLCTFFTLSRLPVSDASTLFNMVPVWVALLSWPILKERPSPRVWFAIGISLAGVYLLTQPHLDEGAPFAVMIGLLSSVCTSIVVIGLNRLGHLDPRAIVLHFSVVSTVILGGVLLASGLGLPERSAFQGRSLLALLGVGLTGTLGQLALTRAFALGEPSRVAVVGLTQLLFGAIYDGLWFHRVFPVTAVIGMMLIAGPSAWLLLDKRQTGTRLPQEPLSSP
jgi:drug/metabolite transporter (DMT)-like permease